MLKRLLLLASASMLLLSCSKDIDIFLPNNDNNENLEPILEEIDENVTEGDEISDSVITDSDGVEINMSWETQEDFFMLLLDFVVEDDDFNEEVSISENEEPFETVEIRATFDDGTYNVIIQGAEFENFDVSEEVTFTIVGFNGGEEVVFTVNVNELQEFNTVLVIEIDKIGDSYVIRQLVDTI